jgi:hypothetical protein
MAKLVVRPVDKGLQTDKLAFNIDNDSFPTLINAYQWRGRVKRKRGTANLTRLTRFFNSNSIAYSAVSTIALSAGAANLLTGFNLQANGNIVPGSVTIVDTTASVTYTDPSMNGTLTGGSGGTINYATGAITITGGGTHSISAEFLYYPDLPVMGLEDLNLQGNTFPGTLAFDTTYSYNIPTTFPYSAYDVSFYKNPPSAGDYVAKTTVTPTTWNGQDYQQFWSTNYQNAFWVTNGINVPFSVTNIGMQYKPIVSVTIVSGGPPAKATLQITGHGLVVGDFVFVNEVATTTGINFQTGYVITVTNANNVIVEFPNATIATNGTGGIAQYLTNRSDVTKDCLRWYDGDPTNGSSTSPTLIGHLGWVNFAPPISQAVFGIEDAPQAQYYLIGARIILPFKDRLLFIGPVIQTSTAGSQIYLQDTVIYSQNGTPFYTASFTGAVNLPTTQFFPILTPMNQSASPASYFEDQTGFGGFISAGTAQPILTAVPNEDVIIIGFSNKQARLVYTGNDILPFNFFSINSELGSSSTFSAITLDRGALTVGPNGIILTTQTSATRIDLAIPDNIFQFLITNNGFSRVCAARDFINEWVYFTYPSNQNIYIYPDQTLQYNYRDDSWAIFNECYTTYGSFRAVTGYTWANIGQKYATWAAWTTPWEAGDSSNLLQPYVIAGNQQGFVVTRDEGTGEANSLYIQNISGNTITSPNHCLNNNDYIVINNVIGTLASQVNGKIFSVESVTANTFTIIPSIGSGTYVGGGTIQRMYVPFIQTKQFPVTWEMARKTRIGVQQYLFTRTASGQITLLIYLSMNATNAYNDGPLYPSDDSQNDSLLYSTILYTCPESTNLGLTPANINLNMVTGTNQSQIWHRMNTSLIGDTVQIGFTLSDAQMRDITFSNQFAEFELHGFILDITPSQILA